MNNTEFFVAILIFSSIIVGALYILFGQLTVRKLRKNPKTKEILGLEYASGWDIINVAQALAFPKSWSRKLEGSRLSFMYASATIIHDNTTKFDRVLGFIFYWLLILSGLSGGLFGFLHFFGLI
ncbi:hypothetical protein [Psychromonas sp. Urea-02u-13]|uniref:hypothetical protein n=1 Tax=Psychromonas sp. Urea-02u-13 TaxID=2058326 RepID=UPI000C321D5B|nr:hypothetical protein [Psychromonas sp. Urea-02u-13]PKG37315.1 hypothetical protein CXF74_19570 [Psychromonas sp. Urea-02u-13]